MFDVTNWYWVVASSETQVFSSASGTFLTLPNATYSAWRNGGNDPSYIVSAAALFDYLTPYTAIWVRALPALVATGSLTLPQQATAALALGLTLTSTGTPALNGTYSATSDMQQNIEAEIDSLLLNNTFTNGVTSIAWPDIAGAPHTFDVTHFKAFATAHAAFVSGNDEVIAGLSTTLPSATATIA